MDIPGLFTTHRKLLLVVALVLLLAFIATFPVYGQAYDVRVLTTILMYVIMAVSWAMFSGVTGYMSLAPAAFFGIGVYSMALLQHTLPFHVIIVIGGLVSFAFALLVGLVTLRLKGMYFAIFTFGLVVFMSEVVYYTESRIGHTRGWQIIPLDYKMLLYTMLGVAVATLLAIYFIRRSKLGLAMLSIGGNEEAAEHMGINTTMVKVLTFAISAIFMGAAGVVTAPALMYVDNRIAFGLFYSFMPILMAVFGGMGQLYGPVIGAVIFGYLEKTLRAQLQMYFMLGFGIVLVAVILFLPNGLGGLMPTVQDKLWGPVPALRKERTWKPTAAGILSILGGVVQAITGILLFALAGYIGGWGWFSAVFAPVMGFLGIISFLLLILGIIAIIGGICALRRSSWGLALAGSICAIPFGGLGSLAIIFTILGKGEFEHVTEGGQAEQCEYLKAEA